MNEKRNDKINSKRIAFYVLALIILGCGIAMNTKTNLGVSPVISVAYNIAQILEAPIGVVTFLYYCFLILMQFFLLKGKLPLYQVLQVAASFITSLFIQVFDYLLPTPNTMLMRILSLLLAIVITGIGACLSIRMNIVPNPADGLANVIGGFLKKDLGFGKNVLDTICILLAIVIGLIFKHALLGIGIGTVIAVILTGRVMAFVQPLADRIYESCLRKEV